MPIQRGVLALFAGLLALSTGIALAGDTYKVDPVLSSAVVRVKQLNVSYIYGRIDGPEGTIVVDESDPTKTTFDVQLQAKNIDTANQKRDDDLRGPDFFSVKEFPTLSFKSTSVKAAGENKMEVTGDLTIHGQTKPITVTLEHV